MLRFHPEALVELDAAVAWHERERPGHGALLFRDVTKRVAQASRFPRSGTPLVGFEERLDVRQFVLRRFRYVIITARVLEDRQVVAIAHTSRSPGYWRRRLA